MSSVPYSKNLCSVEGVKTKNLNNVIRDKGTIGRQNMAVKLSISSDIFHWNIDMLHHPSIYP